ncbi:hypothetical protein FIBSPDRAFT_863966 [Athelia psychrophila]|uniref:Fungal-type protein kinase domain-containing protein n=1 Tax=Athelia psychrophila TaxID=1759441 RepID=A0A166GY53_9AGAM|nr:hypothetical protein FIBSPDRAFT_863966 [Fibularhizoctonia sp. CBS 109695]
MDNVVRPKNLERTGTVPFLSLDILSNPDFQPGYGLVDAIYKHDCDSFKWVFLYVCCIDNPNSAVKWWLTNNPVECVLVKRNFLIPPEGGSVPFKVSARYTELTSQAIDVFDDLHQALQRKQLAYDAHLARLRQLQKKKLAEQKKRVPQPPGNGASSSLVSAVPKDGPKGKGGAPMLQEKPEQESAPLPVDLWETLRAMIVDL